MSDSRKPGWFHSLKTEFVKIFWPDKASAARQTTAVVVVSAIMGVLIVLFDMIIQFGLDHLFKI